MIQLVSRNLPGTIHIPGEVILNFDTKVTEVIPDDIIGDLKGAIGQLAAEQRNRWAHSARTRGRIQEVMSLLTMGYCWDVEGLMQNGCAI